MRLTENDPKVITDWWIIQHKRTGEREVAAIRRAPKLSLVCRITNTLPTEQEHFIRESGWELVRPIQIGKEIV